MRGVLLTNDLMFSSRVLGTAQAGGWRVDCAMSEDALAQRLAGGDVSLVVIDLVAVDQPLGQLVAAIRAGAPNARVVAYGPHVDQSRLSAAQAAGCDAVLSRGQFVQDLPVILRTNLAS